MSDRAEFEKWYDEATDCNYGVAYYVDITGRYCHHDIGIAWQAWQAALAKSRQCAEPVAEVWPSHHYVRQNHINWLVDVDDLPNGAELYTQPQPAQQGSVSEGENDFGLDARYFHGKLSLILRDINSYTPTEIARALGRLAITANPETMREPEFSIRDLIDEPKYRDPTPQPEGDGWVKCSERLPKLGQRVQLFSQGVIQHMMPLFDGSDEGPFWDFEVHDDNPLVDMSRDQWRPLPQPPQEGSGDE